jgi:hypothetical protein
VPASSARTDGRGKERAGLDQKRYRGMEATLLGQKLTYVTNGFQHDHMLSASHSTRPSKTGESSRRNPVSMMVANSKGSRDIVSYSCSSSNFCAGNHLDLDCRTAKPLMLR